MVEVGEAMESSGKDKDGGPNCHEATEDGEEKWQALEFDGKSARQFES